MTALEQKTSNRRQMIRKVSGVPKQLSKILGQVTQSFYFHMIFIIIFQNIRLRLYYDEFLVGTTAQYFSNLLVTLQPINHKSLDITAMCIDRAYEASHKGCETLTNLKTSSVV